MLLKNSATALIPNLCWNFSQMSGRSPLPYMQRTLWLRSSGDGGAASRYRATSPTYTKTVAWESRISRQKLRTLNFLPRAMLTPVVRQTIMATAAVPWYSGMQLYQMSPPGPSVSSIDPRRRASVLYNRAMVNAQPLGMPVVPEVYRRMAGSAPDMLCANSLGGFVVGKLETCEANEWSR